MLLHTADKRMNDIKQNKDHLVQLENNVAMKHNNDLDLPAGETLDQVQTVGGYNRLHGQAYEDALAHQQLQSAHLSSNHIKYNVKYGEAIFKGKKFYQPPSEETNTGIRLVKKISDVQFSPGSQLNLDNDPFFDEASDRPKHKKVKLEYPLRERILNSRGQSIVYVDYKDRFRDGT